MPRSPAELKAELQAQAAQLIEELFAWNEQAQAPTLAEIEEQVLRLRKRFGEQLAQAVVHSQPAVEPVTVACPQCQQPMHLKRRRQRKHVESRVGGLPVQRAYYYCATCRVGLFPPGSATGGSRPGLE